MELSPRVSFSASPTFTGSSFRLDDSLPVEPPSAEFDFSTSYEASTLKEDSSTPADLLFSQGRLLPLHRNPTCSTQLPPKPKHLQEDSNKQELNVVVVGRSSSVSSSSVSSSSKTSKTAGSAACQLIPRSKSTGCNLNQNLQYPSKSRRQLEQARTASRFWKSPSESSTSSSSSSSAKAYYYSGDRRVSCGTGVRINPVINVPASFIPRGGSSGSSSSGGSGSSGGRRSRTSFFAYLLCSCRDKNMNLV